jgi:hypothetical protein
MKARPIWRSIDIKERVDEAAKIALTKLCRVRRHPTQMDAVSINNWPNTFGQVIWRPSTVQMTYTIRQLSKVQAVLRSKHVCPESCSYTASCE